MQPAKTSSACLHILLRYIIDHNPSTLLTDGWTDVRLVARIWHVTLTSLRVMRIILDLPNFYAHSLGGH